MPTTLLFISSNPFGTPRLELDEEFRAIEDENARANRALELRPILAARVEDVRRGIRDHAPAIVHFAGHGRHASDGESSTEMGSAAEEAPGIERDVIDPETPHDGPASTSGGIVVKAADGSAHVLPTDALGELFRLLNGGVRMVVLNACHSEALVGAIVPHVECVVGTRAAILDTAALAFARGFYAALVKGENVQRALEWGRYEIRSNNLSGAEIPVLHARDGTDPEKMIFAGPAIATVDRRVSHAHRPDLVGVLEKLPVTSTYGGRSQLLDGLRVNLNRSETNPLLDLQEIVSQLRGRRTREGRPCLAVVIDNALRFAEGTEIETLLAAARDALEPQS